MTLRLPTYRFVLALALLLGGCDDDGKPLFGPGSVDDDDPTGLSCAGTEGEPSVAFILDDETHTTAPDGTVYDIEQRPQGDVTIFAPLRFDGLDGGTIVDAFSIRFVDATGTERGARRSTRFQLPCEEDGDVAAHHYEVFFGNPSIPPSTYDGMTGTLTAQFTTNDGALISSVVQAVIRDASP